MGYSYVICDIICNTYRIERHVIGAASAAYSTDIPEYMSVLNILHDLLQLLRTVLDGEDCPIYKIPGFVL